MAEAMGVSRQTINSIETGKYLPSLPLAFSLAAYFDIGVEELFHAED
ncbi:MAG: helix-turn-helix transcriptional regulator [Actinomycetota bacterium]|nr:helix-turn-helix transcriptional regulator [Actinomycetota bacterium]